MALTYPPYDSYDGFSRSMSRSLSRRHSLNFPNQGFPYDQSQMFGDPMLENYPRPSYPIYGPQTAPLPMGHHLSAPSFDDAAVRDGYFDGRMSAPMTPMIRPRQRRHSTVSFSSHPTMMDGLGYSSLSAAATHIKFKRKGSFMAGVSLVEAQGHLRLSSNDLYTTHDLHADRRGSIFLKVKWSGYPSLTYDVPLDTYDGRVSLQTLARRVARACVHYLQTNIIPVPFDCVELHHLEEVSYGVWQPMLLTTR